VGLAKVELEFYLNAMAFNLKKGLRLWLGNGSGAPCDRENGLEQGRKGPKRSVGRPDARKKTVKSAEKLESVDCAAVSNNILASIFID
jgi:hypothetical protein